MELMDRQVDHLILLVGGNPLPNAVAGRVLVKPGGAISLIYSQDTSAVAERLRNWLGNDYHYPYTDAVDESFASSIMAEVRRALDKQPDAASVGLNYTGGTKAMAVHAYRGVERWAEEHQRAVSCSYLDARTHQMVFDAPPGKEYIGDTLKLRLQDLLDLHGWELQNKPHEHPILPKTAHALAQVHTTHGDDQAITRYIAWKGRELDKARKEGKREWLKETKLKTIKLAWPDDPALDEVTQTLKAELHQEHSPELDIGSAVQVTKLSAEGFLTWLDGSWLEHRVLDALGHLSNGLQPNHIQSETPESFVSVITRNPQFEFDVAAVFGYQLFAFSCTTDTSKPIVKQKLFECVLRARQLGGDQACAALVCPYKDPDELQSELRQQIDFHEQLKVFGASHLADLEAHLSQWIEEQHTNRRG